MIFFILVSVILFCGNAQINELFHEQGGECDPRVYTRLFKNIVGLNLHCPRTGFAKVSDFCHAQASEHQKRNITFGGREVPLLKALLKQTIKITAQGCLGFGCLLLRVSEPFQIIEQ